MQTSKKEAEKLLKQARADYEAALAAHEETERAFNKEPSEELARKAAEIEGKLRAFKRLVAVREKQLEEATLAEAEAARRKQIAELAEQHEKLRVRAREALRQYERLCSDLTKAVDVLKEVGSEADIIANKARALGAILPRLGPGELKSTCEQYHGPLRSWTKPVNFKEPPADLEAPRGLVDVRFARAFHTTKVRAEAGEEVITTRSLSKRFVDYLETSDEPEAEAAE